jgi:hypothetical protein
MILNALVERLKRRSKDDFKGRHYEASLILQAVSWYLRYPLSYRDIEELFLERGLEVDHSTLNRWVLAYAPLIERRLRTFRKPHCGSIRVDEELGCLLDLRILRVRLDGAQRVEERQAEEIDVLRS